MDSTRKKAARTEWRERKMETGVFAVRCAGAAWVGATRTLDKAENRIRFELRTGMSRIPGLQAAWSAAEEGGLVYEVLERLDPELSDMARDRLLKEKAVAWRDRLGAHPA